MNTIRVFLAVLGIAVILVKIYEHILSKLLYYQKIWFCRLVMVFGICEGLLVDDFIIYSIFGFFLLFDLIFNHPWKVAKNQLIIDYVKKKVEK